MTDEPLDNPAARLGYWLPKAIEPAARAASARTNRSQQGAANARVRDVWAEIWGLDINEPADLLKLFDNGLMLVNEAHDVRRTATSTQSPYGELALEHFDQVERCVAHLVAMEHSRIEKMMEPMQQGGWQSLKLLSTLLREHERETVPSDETRQSLIEQTQKLILEVLEDDALDSNTKAEIYKSLSDVQDSLVRFTIGGAPIVLQATDRLCGTIVRTILVKGEQFLDHPATRLVSALLSAISVAFGIPADFRGLSSGFAGAQALEPGGGGGSVP